MTYDNFMRKYQDMTASEIISQLEEEYKENAEALEDIERAKKDIQYIEKQKDYKGQTPKQRALSLVGNLAFWA